jgi:hypothetical protein
MDVELREIGLDPKALPPLEKLSPDQLRKVMKTFTKALGIPCKGCHDTSSFRAPTKNKKIAAHMWNDFARGLVTAEGEPLYCDGCHAGHKDLLDRRDLDLLTTWMKASFVEPLKRADGNENDCATCHGKGMEPKIFTRLWK